MNPAVSPFGANSSLTIPSGPVSCSAQTIQQREEHERHRQRQVQIGVGAAEQRLIDREAMLRCECPHPIVPDAGEESDPVGRKDEDEDGGEEPEGPLDQMRADDALEEPVQALHQPLEKILRAPLGTCDIFRVATCAKTMRPTATIQVTTIEFVIGKPNGLPISTAFCDRPCCAGCSRLRHTMSSAPMSVASTARPMPRPRGADADR